MREHVEVDWVSLFTGNRVAHNWEVFKSEIRRVQGKHVSVRVKSNAGKFREP